MAEAETKRSRKEEKAYRQAVELVTVLYEVNNYDLDEDAMETLDSESEMPAGEDAAKYGPGKIYEGIFKLCQGLEEIKPLQLWDRAQQKLADEKHKRLTAQSGGKKSGNKAKKIPFVHQRLLRMYWMVRLAAEDLIAHNPRIKMGKVLLEVEENLKEAFVDSDEAVKLPLATLRKKQWSLLSDYGMSLTVDKIFDLHPRRWIIHLHHPSSLLVGIVIGLLIGLLIGQTLSPTSLP